MTRRLAQMAQKVGASEATVSRVLNGKPGVSDATRKAVLSALDVLGYERPTRLRGERARLVGLVLPELQNPVFPAFAEAVGGALTQQRLTQVLCTQTKGGVSESDYVELLLQQQVSAVVFAGGLCSANRPPPARSPRSRAPPCRTSTWPGPCARWRAGRPPPCASSTRASRASSAPAIRSRSELCAARAAVELLCVQIGGRTMPSDELLFEPELVVCGSTAQPPRTASR